MSFGIEFVGGLMDGERIALDPKPPGEIRSVEWAGALYRRTGRYSAEGGEYFALDASTVVENQGEQLKVNCFELPGPAA